MAAAKTGAGTTATPSGSGAFGWILALVAAVIVILTVIDLGSEIYFSLRAQHETGTILSTERASGRSRSVYARVQVAPQGGPASSAEIHDTFGRHGWKEGDRVDLLCARIHADHVNCVVDAWLDRYVISLGVLAIVVALVWLRLRVRAKERAAARAAAAHG
jgi:hypothetical protein